MEEEASPVLVADLLEGHGGVLHGGRPALLDLWGEEVEWSEVEGGEGAEWREVEGREEETWK